MKNKTKDILIDIIYYIIGFIILEVILYITGLQTEITLTSIIFDVSMFSIGILITNFYFATKKKNK